MRHILPTFGIVSTAHNAGIVSLALGISFTCGAGTASAQAQGKAANPSAKLPVRSTSPSGPVVLGTTQLPGDFGKLGTTYTVGKAEPLNFTLQSAAYSITPLVVGNRVWVPTTSQKLLILNYTVHNPLLREQRFDWSSFRVTAVDAEDKNQEMIDVASRTGTDEALSVQLKPAQKVNVTIAVLVPAKGVVPKLIVQREKDAPVVRYDLQGKVAALPEGIADPADTDGATVRREIPAKQGTIYQTGVFDLRLEEVSSVAGPLIGRDAGKGNRFITMTFTLKNHTNVPESFYWGTFQADLIDADGEKVGYEQALLKPTRDEKTDGKLAPGEEARVRFFFPLSTKVAPKTLRLSELKEVQSGTGRVFAFDLGNPQ